MLNSPQFYVELGAKAAEARNQRDEDEARAKFHAEHFRKAKALAWRAEIARDCWKEFLDEPMPEGEDEMCRVYWEVAGECMNHAEYFNIEEKEIL